MQLSNKSAFKKKRNRYAGMLLKMKRYGILEFPLNQTRVIFILFAQPSTTTECPHCRSLKQNGDGNYSINVLFFRLSTNFSSSSSSLFSSTISHISYSPRQARSMSAIATTRIINFEPLAQIPVTSIGCSDTDLSERKLTIDTVLLIIDNFLFDKSVIAKVFDRVRPNQSFSLGAKFSYLRKFGWNIANMANVQYTELVD